MHAWRKMCKVSGVAGRQGVASGYLSDDRLVLEREERAAAHTERPNHLR
jgi:hypothetical protein